MGKPIVVVLPTGELFDQLFPHRVMGALESIAQVRLNPGVKGPGGSSVKTSEFDSEGLGRSELRDLLEGATACITSWGSPLIDAALVHELRTLRFHGHAAGTLRGYTEPAAIQGGLTVCHASAIMAEEVGEMALCLALVLLRNVCPHDRAFRDKSLSAAGGAARGAARGAAGFGSPLHPHSDGLLDQKVGLIGFGYAAREFARLLKPFTSDVVAYDPVVDESVAAAYGVRLTTFEDALTSKVVSLHAASIPQTHHMMNAASLALIPDGSVLVNTARGSLIDEAALVAEVRSGRIRAALDVYDPEPPTADSPLRELEDLVMTPHIAGPTEGRRWAMAQAMVEDFARFLRGEPLQYQLDVKRWSVMG